MLFNVNTFVHICISLRILRCDFQYHTSYVTYNKLHFLNAKSNQVVRHYLNSDYFDYY